MFIFLNQTLKNIVNNSKHKHSRSVGVQQLFTFRELLAL